MKDQTTQPAIEDRKVEVVKLPPAEPFTQEELNRRVSVLVDTIRTHGCETLAIRAAQNIAAGEYGGRYKNVENAFPQLTVAPAMLDADKNKLLDGQELTATTLAAGKWMADHPGSSSKDVPLNQEFLDNFKMGLELIQGPQASSCQLPGKPIFPAKTVSHEPGKSR